MYLKILAAMFAIAVMAGCNTMAGAGKGVQVLRPAPRTALKGTVFLVGLVVFNLQS